MLSIQSNPTFFDCGLGSQLTDVQSASIQSKPTSFNHGLGFQLTVFLSIQSNPIQICLIGDFQFQFQLTAVQSTSIQSNPIQLCSVVDLVFNQLLFNQLDQIRLSTIDFVDS